MMARVSVVFPEDSGPKISMTRPRGIPPTPSAISRPNEPVGIESTSYVAPASPKRMTEPLPNCFSIWLSAAARAFFRFSSMGIPQQSVPLLFHIQRPTLTSYAMNSQSFPLGFTFHPVVARCRLLYTRTPRRPFLNEPGRSESLAKKLETWLAPQGVAQPSSQALHARAAAPEASLSSHAVASTS